MGPLDHFFERLFEGDFVALEDASRYIGFSRFSEEGPFLKTLHALYMVASIESDALAERNLAQLKKGNSNG